MSSPTSKSARDNSPCPPTIPITPSLLPLSLSTASTTSGTPTSHPSQVPHNPQASSNVSSIPKSVSTANDTNAVASSKSVSTTNDTNADTSENVSTVTAPNTAGRSKNSEREYRKHVQLDWTSSDHCPYYPVRRDGCTEPRSCRDCLNVNVGDGYSCMVNQYGRCVQKTSAIYNNSLDFSYQEPSNDGISRVDQKVQFPSDKVNYCFHGDNECKMCRDGVFKDVMDGNRSTSLTKFCYGKNGCVCIAICEAPMWKKTVGQTVCNGTTVNLEYESQYANAFDKSMNNHGHLDIVLAGVIGGLATVIVLVAVVVYVRHRRLEAANSANGSNRDSTDDDVASSRPGSSTLSLFGWQAMRSELIEREQLLLAGVDDFSTVRTGYLQLLDVDASAPPQEEDQSSAPTLLAPLAGASAPSFHHVPSETDMFTVLPSAPLESPSNTSAISTPLEVEELM